MALRASTSSPTWRISASSTSTSTRIDCSEALRVGAPSRSLSVFSCGTALAGAFSVSFSALGVMTLSSTSASRAVSATVSTSNESASVSPSRSSKYASSTGALSVADGIGAAAIALRDARRLWRGGLRRSGLRLGGWLRGLRDRRGARLLVPASLGGASSSGLLGLIGAPWRSPRRLPRRARAAQFPRRRRALQPRRRRGHQERTWMSATTALMSASPSRPVASIVANMSRTASTILSSTSVVRCVMGRLPSRSSASRFSPP